MKLLPIIISSLYVSHHACVLYAADMNSKESELNGMPPVCMCKHSCSNWNYTKDFLRPSQM